MLRVGCGKGIDNLIEDLVVEKWEEQYFKLFADEFERDMEQDRPVHCGILLIPPQGKILIKKTWQQRYCQLYKASKSGIGRLEIYEGLDEASVTKSSSSRIITLENCIKITQKSETTFSLITKTASYDFATTTQQSLAEWLVALQSVAFRDETSKITSIEEDNELYCSSGEGVFNVKLHSSEASARCGLEPQHYILVLTSIAIQLRNNEDNRLLYTWPYRFIRRYGYRDGKFTFEAGRKCESGEGTFHLEHANQQEIFRCVACKMKSMKKLLNGEPASSVLYCGDNQFQAALGMEARSRSPLPPSPTTSTSLQELESHGSNKSVISMLDISLDKKFNSVTKITPVKPPRKCVSSKGDGNAKYQNYEPVDKYDQIEYRNEAWRTLGTNDVKHTENIGGSNEELDEYVSWGRTKPDSPVEQKLPKTSKVITQVATPAIEDDSYDRLNFFGSCSKLNVTKAGYKQVSPAPVVPVQSPPSLNDYDEVEPAMESIRIADDSHLGYAMIRKSSKEPVDHQFHNDDPYAIISKPKRV